MNAEAEEENLEGKKRDDDDDDDDERKYKNSQLGVQCSEDEKWFCWPLSVKNWGRDTSPISSK